ncbi:MAG: hypothetical protein RRZ85_11165 [Gordonibacter sp.]|uniref:hypothetical protein n=1 Tax=Gordonibacter sp. TaxID=1968902 RepID=UPI002FC6C0EB
MLNEVDLQDIPERGKFGCDPTETSIFCEATLGDFMKSSIRTAEVNGWPKGDPKNSKQAGSYLSSMNSKIKGMHLENVMCVSRGKRLFLMKTVIRKEALSHA